MKYQVAGTVVWSLLSLVAGASCLSSTGVANIKDTSRIDGNDGVLVTTIETNFRGRVSVINIHDSRSSEELWVEPGLNFKIIKLPSGTYRWYGIHVSSGPSGPRVRPLAPLDLWGAGSDHCGFPDHEEFAIIGSAINYVGDPEIFVDDDGVFDAGVCHWSVRDHGTEARRHLRVSYPKLSDAHGFTWSLTKGTVPSLISDSTLEAGEPRPVANPRAVIAKVLTDTASFRDQLCACEDKTCVDRVSHAMGRWTREFGLDSNSPKLTAEERTQLDETTRALRECRSAAVARRSHADPSPTPTSP